MKRPVVSVVVVLLVLALLLGGLIAALASMRSDEGGSSARSASPVSVTPEAGATEAPDPALEQFYSQQLDWAECRGQYWCADLTVPLDYADPGGETIDLALLKVPAEQPDARVGSLVVNPGGPGAPGTDYAAQAGFVFRDPLRAAFDIVGFDPRGTGASAPVDCLTDEELDGYLAADPDPDTATEEQDYVDWVELMGRGCADKSGDLAAHVTTIEAARDMDVLRAALGEQSLTYFGASYGTKLGATYAELFPERVGRLVLDGAVDVDMTSLDLSLGQARGFEVALRAYVEDCVAKGGCFLGDSVGAGLGRISQLLEQVDAAPLPTAGERELQVGNAFYGIVTPLYNRDYWFLLSQALQQALDGDGSTLLELADLYASRGPSGYTDNSAEAIFAINCLDDPWSVPASEVPDYFDEFEEASPTFGRVFAWGLVNCQGIEVESTVEPLDIRAEGAAPIVVVGTTRDPATPMEWAVALADQLESGVLIERDGDGHTGYNAGNACVDEAIEAYLLKGTVPKDGLTC